MHDSSDTASAGSPANTISSSTSVTLVPVTGTTPIKAGVFPSDNATDIRISLVPPPTTTITTSSPQTPAASQPANNREDYDSSATVSHKNILLKQHRMKTQLRYFKILFNYLNN